MVLYTECSLTESLGELQCLFEVKLGLDVVHIASGLQSGISEANERIEGLLHLVLLEVPTWAFGTEPDLHPSQIRTLLTSC